MLNLYDNGKISNYDKENLTSEEAAVVAAANFAQKTTPEIIPNVIFRHNYVYNGSTDKFEKVGIDKLTLVNHKSKYSYLWPLFIKNDLIEDGGHETIVKYRYQKMLTENNEKIIPLDSVVEYVVAELIDRDSVVYYEDYATPLLPLIYDVERDLYAYYSTDEYSRIENKLNTEAYCKLDIYTDLDTVKDCYDFRYPEKSDD